jgi:hypothetical protein
MRTKLPAVLAAAALAVTLVGPAAQAKVKDSGTSETPCDGGTVTTSPTNLWPPNHKMRTITMQFDTPDNDGDTLTLTVTNITSDEAVDAKGSGHTSPDFTGVGNTDDGVDTAPPAAADPATTTAQVRGERAGKGDGRTYTITVQCTDQNNIEGGAPETGTASVTVTVPHDQRNTHSS